MGSAVDVMGNYLWTSASGISGAPAGFDGSDTAKNRLRAWLGAPDANTSGTDPPRSVCSTSSVFAYKSHGTVKGGCLNLHRLAQTACRPQKQHHDSARPHQEVEVEGGQQVLEVSVGRIVALYVAAGGCQAVERVQRSL